MTSLNGPGFSITLLNADTEMLTYLDVPTLAPGWVNTLSAPLDPSSILSKIIETNGQDNSMGMLTGPKGILTPTNEQCLLSNKRE